ncbi:MAG: AAA family ATPase, partial [Pirellulaceae bacterium]
MPNANDAELLEVLSGKRASPGERDPWTQLTAKPPAHEAWQDAQEVKLAEVLDRIGKITGKEEAGPDLPATPSRATTPEQFGPDAFVPPEPKSIREAGLIDSEVEALALKYVLARGDISGRDIAEQIKIPFVLLDAALRQLKLEQLM